MDHIEAVKTHAAEKYFLGELAGTERDAFEEHFFDCEECAADVKATAILVDNVREALRTAPDQKKSPARETAGFLNWWRPAYSLAAIALLLATVGYQNFVQIPQLHNQALTKAEALPSFSLVAAGSRGAAGALEVTVPANTPFGLYVDIPSDSSFTRYSADILSQSGALKFSVPISTAQTQNTVQLLIPGALLNEGQYDLVIRGHKADSSGAQEIARHPFVLRRK
ncbi:MAG: zf-HC2 domain-containing protein [Terriglobia bacterium]|nr:zf-HC2 domain-containing protein [Terriglobia bacterium]